MHPTEKTLDLSEEEIPPLENKIPKKNPLDLSDDDDQEEKWPPPFVYKDKGSPFPKK